MRPSRYAHPSGYTLISSRCKVAHVWSYPPSSTTKKLNQMSAPSSSSTTKGLNQQIFTAISFNDKGKSDVCCHLLLQFDRSCPWSPLLRWLKNLISRCLPRSPYTTKGLNQQLSSGIFFDKHQKNHFFDQRSFSSTTKNLNQWLFLAISFYDRGTGSAAVLGPFIRL